MRERRAFLRGLLSRLIAEQPGGESLYVPHGEAGMRRMIRHLIAMRPADTVDAPLQAMIDAFLRLDAGEEGR